MKMIDKAKIENTTIAIISKHIKRGSSAKYLQKIILAEKIKLKEIEANDKFLGALVKSPKGTFYIFINKAINNEGRRNFTLSHELGHFILQHYLQKAAFYCSESDIKEEGETSSEQEKEANYFASCFLLPRDRLIKEFTRSFIWYTQKHERIFLHVLPSGKSYSDWKKISNKLLEKFNVSKTALKIRLMELGLISCDF